VHAVPRRRGLALSHHPPHRDGRGPQEDLDLLLDLADNIQGRTICALGDAAAMPVRAFVKTFRDEFEYHIDHKRCQVKPGGYSSARAHSRERWRRTDMPINLEIDGKPSRSTTAPR
jgi:hypothetical protein